MKRTERMATAAALVLLDSLMIALAMFGAYWVRIESQWLPYYSAAECEAYLVYAVIVLPVWILTYASGRLYSTCMIGNGLYEYAQVAKADVFGVVAVILLSFWKHSLMPSRGVVLLLLIFSTVMVCTGRFGFRRMVARLRRKGRLQTRILVVGANEHGKAIARQFGRATGEGMVVLGFLDDYQPPGSLVMDDLRVLALPSEIDQVVVKTAADQIVIISEALAWESLDEIVRRLSSRPYRAETLFSPGLYEIATMGMQVREQACVPLLSLRGLRVTGLDSAAKRAIDLALAALLAVPAAVAGAIIALTTRLTGSGPVLDRCRVLGAGGRRFVTYKFRTGLTGSSRRTLERSGLWNAFETRSSHRFRSFLYCTGLDKIPQLMNVVLGQMSFVGPRTISTLDFDSYDSCLPALLTVKPGMTGSWAVSPSLSVADELRLTLYYIRNWNIWADIEILIQTAALILTARRARPQRDWAHESLIARDPSTQASQPTTPAEAGYAFPR